MDLSKLDLSDPDLYVDDVPHEVFRQLRTEAPVFWNEQPDGRGFWVLTRYPEVVQVNRDWETFSSWRGTALLHEQVEDMLEQQRLMMLNMDPPMHTRYRLLVNKGFTPRMVAKLEETMRERANAIIDGIAERGECDFVVDVAAELPLQVIADIMGVPQEDRHKVFDWSNRMIGSEDPEYAVSETVTMEASAELYAYANTLAAHKRANPADDVISVLLNAEVEGDVLSELDFDLFFLLLAVAGNETTRNLIAHGMKALCDFPDQRQKLLDDPSKIPGAVEEMLRWGTPVMFFRRTATRDVEIAGQAIAEDDRVTIWYISANRDETVFPNPYSFDVERTPNEHVAFGGGGPHFCLGANLARMEIRVMFEELLRRLPDIDLSGPVSRLRSNFINGIKHMPMTFTPTSKSAAA